MTQKILYGVLITFLLLVWMYFNIVLSLGSFYLHHPVVEILFKISALGLLGAGAALLMGRWRIGAAAIAFFVIVLVIMIMQDGAEKAPPGPVGVTSTSESPLIIP